MSNHSEASDPRPIYEPVLIDDTGNIDYQGGAFFEEEQAQAVLDIWRREGIQQEMAVNVLGLYESLADWHEDR